MLGQSKSPGNPYFLLTQAHTIEPIIGSSASSDAVYVALLELEAIDPEIQFRDSFCLLLRRHGLIALDLLVEGERKSLYVPSPLASGHALIEERDQLEREFDGRLRLSD